MSAYRSIQLFWITLAVCFLSSCGEDPPLRLTSRERVRIDTLFTIKVQELSPNWDSLCEAKFDKMVDMAVDSIIRVRREEEIRLRNRLKQQGGVQ